MATYGHQGGYAFNEDQRGESPAGYTTLGKIRQVAKVMDSSGDPYLGDDALKYDGSATWGMWQNHVPQIIASVWPTLSEQTRLAVYVTAKSFANFQESSEIDRLSRQNITQRNELDELRRQLE